MREQEALEWIHSKLAFGIKPGLERMNWMLEHADHPEIRINGVHVVGTNGKGSTVNNLQKIFTTAGYEVGTFTSPYIIDFKERISVNGTMISTEDFIELVEKAQPIVERLPKETDLEPATEFEVITFLMFLYFGQIHPVDIVFIEAGMGGRYDSTNVFDPLAVIITSIGLDHQAVLGQTHEEIAKEKVGVLKDSVPLIYSTELESVASIFENVALKMASPSYRYQRDFNLISVDQEHYQFVTDRVLLKDIVLAMPGQHQVSNAALALQTVYLLKDTFPKVTDKAIKVGLKQAQWIGRTEFVTSHLMIDGAHNNESIDALVEVLKENYSDKKIHILFSAINTKPVESMLERLAQFDDLTVTTFDYPTALPLADYPSTYQKIGSVEEWLSKVPTSSNDLYVITGSLYFINQVRPLLIKQFEKS